MMKYYHGMYISEKLVSKKSEILSKLEKNQLQFEKYLIVLANNGQNQLEIFNSVMLIQKNIKRDELFIVGIANGYNEALELVEKITRQVYDETKGLDIKKYILRSQQEYEEGNV